MSEDSALRPDPEGAMNPPEVPVEDQTAVPKRHIPRRVLTWILVVLFALMTPLALTSAWAVKTLTNTQRYVDTMQPLAKDPVIQSYVANKATDALFSQLDVQKKIANTLPVGGSFIAAPLTAELKTFTNKQVLKLVSSTWFSNLWEKENRFTQQQALAVLTGKPAPPLTTARKLVINLTPALVQAVDTLDQKGITVFDPIKEHLSTTRSLSLQLMDNQQVKQVQGFFRIAVDARTALLVITPLIGLAAIGVAVRRRRAAFRVAVAGALGCLLLSIGLTFAKQSFIGGVPTESQLVAQHIFDILSRFLHGTLHWAIGLFVIAAIILWVVGDTPWAVAGRRAVTGGSKQLGGAVDQARKSETATKVVSWIQKSGRYIGHNQAPFRWIGIVIAAIFVLTDRTAGGLWWTLIVLVIYQLVIVLLQRWSKRPEIPAVEQGSSEAALTSSGSDTTET